MSNAKGFQSRIKNEQQLLLNLVFEVDGYASAAASRIRTSPFKEHERRFYAPPPGAGVGQKYKKWLRHHEDQLCIDACLEVRGAIFADD